MIRGWKQGLLALPGVGVTMLPKLTCPLCWPAYASLLSSFGLGFLIRTIYLVPLTVMLLVLALAALALRASKRRGYGPFLIAFPAAAAVLLGKFLLESNLMTYSAVAVLVGASLWNAWPRRATSSRVTTCPSCPRTS